MAVIRNTCAIEATVKVRKIELIETPITAAKA